MPDTNPDTTTDILSPSELRRAAVRMCVNLGQEPNDPVPVGKHPGGGVIATQRWKFYRDHIRNTVAALEAIGFVQSLGLDELDQLPDPDPDEGPGLPPSPSKILTPFPS